VRLLAISPWPMALHSAPQGESAEVDEKGIFTHVLSGARRWLCINSQRTVLRQDTSGKQKKPSTAEEPSHPVLL